MRLDIYVNYRGNCEAAFRFYEQHLGGTITGIVRHGEQPNPSIPDDWRDKVLHARIEIGATVLMGRTFRRLNRCATASARRGCSCINPDRDDTRGWNAAR